MLNSKSCAEAGPAISGMPEMPIAKARAELIRKLRMVRSSVYSTMIWQGLGFRKTVSFLGPEWQITMRADSTKANRLQPWAGPLRAAVAAVAARHRIIPAGHRPVH